MLRKIGKTCSIAFIILVIFSITAIYFIDRPFGLAFVYSESMKPTLNVDDGFILIPKELVGFKQGDVIVFEPKRLPGPYIAHRIVGETERGFITKGDNNVMTDQQTGEPPVPEERIIGKALSVNSRVISLPYMGTLVNFIQRGLGCIRGFALPLAGTLTVVCGLLGLHDYMKPKSPQRRRRKAERRGDKVNLTPNLLLKFTILATAVALTSSMLASSTPYEISYVTVSIDSLSSPMVGETFTRSMTLSNPSILPYTVFLKAENPRVHVGRIQVDLPPRSREIIEVRITAAEKTGLYYDYIHKHSYISILPANILLSLYQVHALLPILVIDGLFIALIVFSHLLEVLKNV